MSNVKTMIDALIEREGRYVNNPNDSGGETNWGITIADARANGYYGDMKTMPRSVAYDIYYRSYWISTGIEAISTLSELVAERLLDIAVNQGKYRAGEFCQRLLNALNRNQRDYKDLTVDGKMGPATRAALRALIALRGQTGTEVFEKGLQIMQGYFYIDLAERRPKDEEFLFGWLRTRV